MIKTDVHSHDSARAASFIATTISSSALSYLIHFFSGFDGFLERSTGVLKQFS